MISEEAVDWKEEFDKSEEMLAIELDAFFDVVERYEEKRRQSIVRTVGTMPKGFER